MFFRINRPRIDLKLRRITFPEKVIHILYLFLVFFDFLQFQIFPDLFQKFLSNPFIDFNGINFNGVRVFLCDLLDFDATFGGGYDGWSLAISVENESEVYLAFDVDAFVD